MFNPNKYRYGILSVKDLIYELSKENPDSLVCIGGNCITHIHVEENSNVISLDYEDLSDSYEEQDVEELRSHKIITQYRAIDMLKVITENLILDQGSDCIKKAYKDLGFDESEIEKLFGGGSNGKLRR